MKIFKRLQLKKPPGFHLGGIRIHLSLFKAVFAMIVAFN
jgi:hypothetical protein